MVSLSPDGRGPYVLEAFHPASGLLTNLGALDCSPFPGEPINGLAVDRSGRLYVSFVDAIIPIDRAADAACVMPWFGAASFDPMGKNGLLQPLGLAFVGQPDGEALHGSFLEGPPFLDVIGTVDTRSGAVSVAGGDAGAPTGDMTGTGDGRLFVSGSSTIAEVDVATGAVLQTMSLDSSLRALGLYLLSTQVPLAFWAGDFFVFPAAIPDAAAAATALPSSVVVRFHPGDSSSAVAGQLDGIVLGAAVSTCAPLH